MLAKKKQESFKRVKAHTVYKLKDGTRVPGATTVLGVLNKGDGLIHWAWDLGMQGIDWRKYRDATADVGTLAHYLVEQHLRGEEPDLSTYSQEFIDKAYNSFRKYLDWEKENDVETIFVESPLVSEKYKYGGTIDCYAKVNGKLTLLDLKTSKAIYPTMIMQLAAYRKLLLEHGYKVQKTMILRIGRTEEEGFEVHVGKKLNKYWKIFQNCLNIYNLKKELKIK